MPFRVMHSIPCGDNSSSFLIRDLRLISSFLQRRSRRQPPAQLPKTLSSTRAKRIVVRWLARNNIFFARFPAPFSARNFKRKGRVCTSAYPHDPFNQPTRNPLPPPALF